MRRLPWQGAEFLDREVGHLLLRETEGRHDAQEFTAVLELVQLFVERVAQVLLRLPERESARSVDRLSVHVGLEGLDGLDPTLALDHRADRDGRAGEGVDPALAHGVEPGDLVGQDQHVLDAQGLGGIDLRVGRARRELQLLVRDFLVRLDAVRVSLAHDERVGHQVVGIGEQHLFAANRIDVHARRHHVELLRLGQPGNQRAELRRHRLHLGHTEARENHLGDRRRLSGDLAVLVDVSERDLTRHTDLDLSGVAQPVQQIPALDLPLLRHSAAGRGAEHTQRRRPRTVEQGAAADWSGDESLIVTKWWSHGAPLPEAPRDMPIVFGP